MNKLFDFYNELKSTSSTNLKTGILKRFSKDDEVKEFLELTYNNVKYTYGVGKVLIKQLIETEFTPGTESIIKYFPRLKESTRISPVEVFEIMNDLTPCDQNLFIRVLDRSLNVGVSKKIIQRIFKGILSKPIYMRCGVLAPKTAKKLRYPCVVQEKADGLYCEIKVERDQDVFTFEARSRSGEPIEIPGVFEQLELNDVFPGVYFGELTVIGITNRAQANGLINSLEPDHSRIKFSAWDFLSIEEYNTIANGGKGTTIYSDRFQLVKESLMEIDPTLFEKTTYVYNVSEGVDGILPTVPKMTYLKFGVIDSRVCHSIDDVVGFASGKMQKGLEGAVVKNLSAVYKDGTSTDQLKIKLKASIEVRCVGFIPGTPGTKRENKVGSIMYMNDEKTIQGSCSGFSDAILDEITANPDNFKNKVFEVEFNDLTESQTRPGIFSLSHPRFIEFRSDKDETDTLEKTQILMTAAKESLF